LAELAETELAELAETELAELAERVDAGEFDC
jgi:hypothetical protein